MEKKSSPLKGKMLPLFLMAASCGMYNILYLCVNFYVPFQSSFGFTNAQMGGLLAAYAALSTPLLFFGGMASDLVNPKALLSISCILTGACGYLLMFFPGYGVCCAIFTLLALPISVHWGAYTKCIGMMGTNEEKGRLFGAANTMDGIMTIVLSLGLTAIIGEAIGTAAGFRWLILVLSSVYFLTGIGIAIFYDYKKWAALNPEAANSKGEKFTWKSVIDAVKEPITWLAAFMVMGSYMASSCLTYMSPYLNNVYVLPVALASAFGVITRYGVKVVAAPIGGTLRDKKLGGSTSKLIWTATAGMAICVALLLLVPKQNAFVVVAVIAALAVIFCFRLNNSSESTVYYGLKRTPMHLMGTIIGLASVLGYSSDLWLPKVIGKILDANGNAGYVYVFMIMLAAMGVASVSAFIMHRLAKKEALAAAKAE
ncbi:MAG: MFS transporter [Clostridia bacterium]|nr:MFS transporter [Clostridia bacterium]